MKTFLLLLCLVLGYATYSQHQAITALQQQQVLGERAATYLFSDTDVRDNTTGKVLRRVDMLDTILHNVLEQAKKKQK